MKRILLIAVLACSILALYAHKGHHNHQRHPHDRHKQRVNSDMKAYLNCVNETGISLEAANAIRTKRGDEILNTKEQDFTACLTKDFISNEELFVPSLQSIIDQYTVGKTIDLKPSIQACERNGITSIKLSSTEEKATFFHCLSPFLKLSTNCWDPDICLNIFW